MELRFAVQAKIKKPVNEVFEAVYNPQKISSYFATGGASGPLDEGTEVFWEFKGYPGKHPVKVRKTIMNEKIIFEWNNIEKGLSTVEMSFEPLDKDSTLVVIVESGWKNKNQESLDQSYGNCRGWSQMVCFLKVYLEYGKILREFF